MIYPYMIWCCIIHIYIISVYKSTWDSTYFKYCFETYYGKYFFKNQLFAHLSLSINDQIYLYQNEFLSLFSLVECSPCYIKQFASILYHFSLYFISTHHTMFCNMPCCKYYNVYWTCAIGMSADYVLQKTQSDI
jgi:hypothetical protein